MDTTIILILGTNAGPWTMSNFARDFEHRVSIGYSPDWLQSGLPPSEETSRLLVGHSLGRVQTKRVETPSSHWPD